MSGARFNIALLDEALSQGATILVPNNRLRDAMLMEIGKQHAGVFRAPDIYAVDIWTQYAWTQLAGRGIAPCCTKRILTGHEELFLWTRIVEDSITQLPLINPEETAASLSRAYQFMKQWQLDQPDDSALQQFTGIPDIAAFLAWSEQFETHCLAINALPLVNATAELARLFRQNPEMVISDAFTLVNFFQPPPLYRDFFAQLGQVNTIFTADPDKTITAINSTRVALPDPASEIRSCAQWAARHLASDPNAHIGVICNARESRHGEFTRAVADELNAASLFNFSGGEVLFNSAGSANSLMSCGIIHDAFLILGLSQTQQSSDDLCRLLQSPYLLASSRSDASDSGDESEARQQMELLMRRRFTKRCDLHEFSNYLSQADRDYSCPQLASTLVQFNTQLRACPSNQSAIAWSETFSELLALCGWPGSKLTSFEMRLLEQWDATLANFAQANAALGPMTVHTAINRLRVLCQRTPQWQETGLHKALSFYSVNEALGLQFDHLWLLGFDDQSWPQPTAPTPFLPHPLQQQFQLPAATSAQQYEKARLDTAVLRQSVSGELIASYYERDGDQEFRPSSFIQALPARDIESITAPGINAFALAARGTTGLRECADPAHLPVSDNEQIRGGHGVLSHQSSCPFRAFAEHRLMVKPLEEFATGLTAMARGSAIHLALDELFVSIQDLQTLTDLSQSARQQHCDDAAEKAIEYLGRHHKYLMTPRFRDIEKRRVAQLLEQFLELEAQRKQFTVLSREAELQFSRHGLSLTLKIDRIDRLADDTLAVLDYKTGKSAARPSAWLEERPEDMQLPVYSVAALQLQEGSVSAVTLAHLHSEKSDYSGLLASDNFHPRKKPVSEDKQLQMQWDELQQRFNTLVDRLAMDFMQGITRVDPAHGDSSCQFCGRQSLCRIRSTTTLAEEADEGNAL
ncbi:MAG: PD-(D/E)XK nuclease family protein [Gammaproteobacteria bacterium]